jgi:hypothetical protein
MHRGVDVRLYARVAKRPSQVAGPPGDLRAAARGGGGAARLIGAPSVYFSVLGRPLLTGGA